jgi:hypothetical protein
MKIGRLILGSLIVVLMAPQAWGHSFAISPSTPISPPIGFEWVAIVALGALAVANAFLLAKLKLARWFLAIPLGVLITAAYAVLFFYPGNFHGTVSTAPPSAPTLPHHVFWGFGWLDVGFTFAVWNMTGLLVLLCLIGCFLAAKNRCWRSMLGGTVVLLLSLCVLAIFGAEVGALCLGVLCAYLFARLRTTSTHRSSLVLLGANIALYLILLTPFIFSGALSHGWAGGYVNEGCRERLTAIERAVAEYAQNHKGTLPEASSIEELMPRIQPYLHTEQVRYLCPLTVCPLGAAYERNPKSYVWNRRFSGVGAASVPEYPDKETDFLLTCPYHWRTALMANRDFIEEIQRAAKQDEPESKPESR